MHGPEAEILKMSFSLRFPVWVFSLTVCLSILSVLTLFTLFRFPQVLERPLKHSKDAVILEAVAGDGSDGELVLESGLLIFSLDGDKGRPHQVFVTIPDPR